MPSRASKELRTLLPPAALILAATALAAMWAPQWSRTLYGVAIFAATASFQLGTPLLAAWSLGSEFQQRTLVLLLTQPASRSRVWMEKWLVLACTATFLLAIQTATLDVGPFDPRFSRGSGRVLWVTLMLCSTPLWTLLARSTIGGMAFSVASAGMLELALSYVVYWFSPPGTPRETFARTPLLDGLRVLYAAGTFAAGWWLFSRYEAGRADRAAVLSRTGTTARLPFLRYRSSGVLRNLLLTELHLHRPTWVVSAGWVACWLAALAIGLTGRASHGAMDVMFSVLVGVYFPVAIVLSGTLSIAEDASLGTHQWRLTWPVSARTQWLVKLATTLAVGAVVAGAVPLAMARLAVVATRSGRTGTPPLLQTETLIVVAGLIVLCFWAAALFGHTVRAVVAAGLMLLALAVCATTAWQVAYRLRIFDSALEWLMVRWHVPPDYFAGRIPSRVTVIALVLVVSSIALVQSLRAFRRVQIRRATIVANVAVLVVAMFATVMAAMTYADSTMRLLRSAPVRELGQAIQAAYPETLQDTSHEVTLEELRRTGLLSAATEDWLEGSEVWIARVGQSRRAAAYEVFVRFPGDRKYQLWIDAPARRQ